MKIKEQIIRAERLSIRRLLWEKRATTNNNLEFVRIALYSFPKKCCKQRQNAGKWQWDSEEREDCKRWLELHPESHRNLEPVLGRRNQSSRKRERSQGEWRLRDLAVRRTSLILVTVISGWTVRQTNILHWVTDAKCVMAVIAFILFI